MKLYKSLSLAAVATIFMGAATSCSLEEENLSGTSTAKEWTTAAGFEKKINDCYFAYIRQVYGQAEDTYIVNLEGGTDIWAAPTQCSGNWRKIQTYDGDFSGLCSEGYAGHYTTINSCNAAIYYADKVEGLTEDKKNALVAEAHFLRAHSLFNIVEMWGGKYLSTDFTTEPMTSLPISKVNDFYDVILEDLEFAMKYLPVKQDVYGHAIRAAAYHLYAKACLTYSTYTDGLGYCDALTDSESKALLQKAKTAAEYLITNASSLGVRLYNEIEEVFDENNNKTNEEALFAVTHSTITAYNPRGNYFNRAWKHYWNYKDNEQQGTKHDGLTASLDGEVNGITTNKLPTGNAYLTPTKYMLDLYVDKDMRYDAFFSSAWLVNNPNSGNYYTWTKEDVSRWGLDASRVGNAAYNIEIGDTAVYFSRRNYTQAEKDATRYAVYNIEDNYKDLTDPGYRHPTLIKGACPIYFGGSKPSKAYSASDNILYRLAETYLMSAEIDWRLGNASATNINVIRNRACKNHDHSLDVTASDITQDFLLDEYARELIGEWGRWFTLKRFRAFESRLPKCNPQAAANFDKSKHYLRPVNTSFVLEIENGDEYQNPGY